METQIAANNGTTNGIQRQGFGVKEIERSGETSSSAIAEQAKAAVQSRYIMAMQNPRDWMQVREAILKECQRPGFAESSRYAKPIGGSTVKGWSVRFAEAAIRCMGNTLVESSIIFEDDAKRIVRVSVTDLESNTTYPTEILIQKTVERSSVKPGQVAIRTRTNSQGKLTYIVEATEDDLLTKAAALVSKALRTNALRLIPGDILDEAEDAVAATLKAPAAADPDAFKKKIVDGFGRLGIAAAAVAEYLGHSIDTATLDELTDLRDLGIALKDKETTWAAVMESRNEARSSEQKPGTTSAADKVKEAMAAKKSTPKSVVEPAKVDDAPPHNPVTGVVVDARETTPAPKPQPGGVADTHALLKKLIADMVEPDDVADVKAKLEAAEELLGTGVAATLWKLLRAAASKIPGAPKF